MAANKKVKMNSKQYSGLATLFYCETHSTYSKLCDRGCHTILRSFCAAKCRPARLKKTHMDRIWDETRQRINLLSRLVRIKKKKLTDNE
jgi:hypothetical protein